MIGKQLSPSEACEQNIRDLYETAFPPEVQFLFYDLLYLLDMMHLDFTAYYEGEKLVGFTIVYPRKSFNWFWYFAVSDKLRGKGYGQQILSMLMNRYKDSTNILDMESPEQVCENVEQRQRRHAFYLRNGFRDTGIGKSFDGVDMTILINGTGTFTMQDYDDVLNELRSFWSSMPNTD